MADAGIIKWQKPMTRVLWALAPIVAAAVYWFGWRVLALLLVANAAAFLTEYLFVRQWKQQVSQAVFVTGTLFTLSVTPALPFWMAVVGVVVGVLFGKMVFGGFGKNVFNPALTGRAFIYVSFGDYMTARWSPPIDGPLGALTAWAAPADAITKATPGMLLKTGAVTGEGPEFGFMELLVGNTSGTIGGTAAVLAILGGLYLIKTKTANYRIVLSGIVGFLVMQAIVWQWGPDKAIDPFRAILAGSFMIGIFFYATDPVSACGTNQGRWLYGAFIGVMSSLITVYSAWPAGTMFAILLANMFAPITDYAIRGLQSKPKAKATAAA